MPRSAGGGGGAAPDDGPAPAGRPAVRAGTAPAADGLEQRRPGGRRGRAGHRIRAGFPVEALYSIDATLHGDLLALAGAEHVAGAESRSETGEPHAAEQPDPRNQQAITVCFAIEHLPGEDHTIGEPRQHELWRDFRPAGWPGPLLGWTTVEPESHRPLTRMLFDAEDDHPRWRFRRILDHATFEEGFARGDISVVNWPQNDYWFGPVIGVDQAEQARHLDAARHALLAADRSATLRRRLRLPWTAPSRRCGGRNPRWARTGSACPGVKAAPGRVHLARAAHRLSAQARRPRVLRRLGGDRLLPTGSTCTPGSAERGISTSAAGLSRSRSAR